MKRSTSPERKTRAEKREHKRRRRMRVTGKQVFGLQRLMSQPRSNKARRTR